MLISDRDIVKKYCGGLLCPLPNGEVQLLLIVMHGFAKKKRKMPPVVNETEQKCTHWCKHWWRHPVVWQPQQFHGEAFLLFLPVLFHLWNFFFFFSSFFSSTLLVFSKSSWSWGLPVIICNSRTKVGCSTPCSGEGQVILGGMSSYCMSGWPKRRGIVLGAQGWESTHGASVYGVEFIFMQLKEAAASLVEWTR